MDGYGLIASEAAARLSLIIMGFNMGFDKARSRHCAQYTAYVTNDTVVQLHLRSDGRKVQQNNATSFKWQHTDGFYYKMQIENVWNENMVKVNITNKWGTIFLSASELIIIPHSFYPSSMF